MQTQPGARARRRTVCDERGYHGPFTNVEAYDRHPEWRGMGDCVVCGLTRDVARHTALQAARAPLATAS